MNFIFQCQKTTSLLLPTKRSHEDDEEAFCPLRGHEAVLGGKHSGTELCLGVVKQVGPRGIILAAVPSKPLYTMQRTVRKDVVVQHGLMILKLTSCKGEAPTVGVTTLVIIAIYHRLDCVKI